LLGAISCFKILQAGARALSPSTRMDFKVGIKQGTPQRLLRSISRVLLSETFGKSRFERFFERIIAVTWFKSSSDAAGAKSSTSRTVCASTFPLTSAPTPCKIWPFQTLLTSFKAQTISFQQFSHGTKEGEGRGSIYTSSHRKAPLCVPNFRSVQSPGISTTSRRGGIFVDSARNWLTSLFMVSVKFSNKLFCSALSFQWSMILRKISPLDSACSCRNSSMRGFATSAGMAGLCKI
jgi:hypothetical protein